MLRCNIVHCTNVREPSHIVSSPHLKGIDMQKEIIELYTKSTETAIEAGRKIAELNMRTFERLMQQQADVAATYMDMANKSISLFGKAKGIQDLIAGQAELSREFGERGMEIMRKGMAVANESGSEYSNLVQEGVKTAQERISEATKATLKAA